MDQISLQTVSETGAEWYSEDFIYASVVNFLKENGYKIQKESHPKDGGKPERVINASKFF